MSAPPRIRSFAPAANAQARLLILGSVPGVASLRAGEYYAHPQNLFWRIAGELCGFDPHAPYRQRMKALGAARIALWDVVQACMREGSLDADIDDASIVANDFATFFRRHPRIVRVCFNGAKAEATWRKHVAQGLGTTRLEFRRLPSTSPANASIALARKREAWREAFCLS